MKLKHTNAEKTSRTTDSAYIKGKVAMHRRLCYSPDWLQITLLNIPRLLCVSMRSESVYVYCVYRCDLCPFRNISDPLKHTRSTKNSCKPKQGHRIGGYSWSTELHCPLMGWGGIAYNIKYSSSRGRLHSYLELFFCSLIAQYVAKSIGSDINFVLESLLLQYFVCFAFVCFYDILKNYKHFIGFRLLFAKSFNIYAKSKYLHIDLNIDPSS